MRFVGHAGPDEIIRPVCGHGEACHCAVPAPGIRQGCYDRIVTVDGIVATFAIISVLVGINCNWSVIPVRTYGR